MISLFSRSKIGPIRELQIFRPFLGPHKSYNFGGIVSPGVPEISVPLKGASNFVPLRPENGRTLNRGRVCLFSSKPSKQFGENSQIVFCMMGGGKFLMDQSGPPSPLYSPFPAPSGASWAVGVSVPPGVSPAGAGGASGGSWRR